ncbi:hypothetical protein A0H81_04669 [Grifola frondosa]|uniref:Uncharacterized protein n=1 Tax=Grifola frondosa TaxID=5627 RepID=A0A1C7MEC5_GRIFR|nr:hypothetical protein A0H81_04669 [Grifola frondosa]
MGVIDAESPISWQKACLHLESTYLMTGVKSVKDTLFFLHQEQNDRCKGFISSCGRKAFLSTRRSYKGETVAEGTGKLAQFCYRKSQTIKIVTSIMIGKMKAMEVPSISIYSANESVEYPTSQDVQFFCEVSDVQFFGTSRKFSFEGFHSAPKSGCNP